MEVNVEVEAITGLSGDWPDRFGVTQRPRPVFAWLDAGLPVGRSFVFAFHHPAAGRQRGSETTRPTVGFAVRFAYGVAATLRLAVSRVPTNRTRGVIR